MQQWDRPWEQGPVQHQYQQWPSHAIPSAPGGRWKRRPFLLMSDSQLQEAAPLTTDAPDIRGSSVFSLRLHVGKAFPLCKQRECELQYRTVTTALCQQGQQLEEPESSSSILRYVQYHRNCSPAEARGRGGYVDLLLHAAPAAVVAVQQCMQNGHIQLGERRVPVSWAAVAQPAGTVCIKVVNPPLQFARQGFTRAMLMAAGYDEVAVVHEQLGHSRLMGDADMRFPCADCIVAYVRAPEDDLILCHLPDTFVVADRPGLPCSIYVDGRTAQQPQLWEQEQEQRLQARQCGRQLQQERILCEQQQEQLRQQTQAQLRAAWAQQHRPAQRQQQQGEPMQEEPQHSFTSQQQQQQQRADAQMEDLPEPNRTLLQQQQQQQALRQVAGQAAAAVAVAAAFPGAHQHTGTAVVLPIDLYAQDTAGPQGTAAGQSGYEQWRGDAEAEYLCTHAEDLVGGMTAAGREAMLQDFYTEHGGAVQSTAADMQWLRRRFPVAAAAGYGDLGEDDGEGYGAVGAAAGESSDTAGASRDQQQGDTLAEPGAAAHVAAPPGTQQPRQGKTRGGGAAAGAAAPPRAAPGAVADVAAPPRAVRRSGRQHNAPDPIFSGSLADFAGLSLRPQQQKRPAAAATPAAPATQLSTPPQRPGPRQRGHVP
jgi:hypothetical protein